jgi:hypothetical protein
MKSGFNQQKHMKTKHTYLIKSHGSNTAVEREVSVLWPDTLQDFLEVVPGGEERVYSLLRGFIAAHHVQSKVKAAFGAEKPDESQRELMQTVEGGLSVIGWKFVPGERGKDDEVVKKLRAAAEAGKLTPEKVDELAARWNGTATGLESLIEVYLRWKAQQAKAKDLGL